MERLKDRKMEKMERWKDGRWKDGKIQSLKDFATLHPESRSFSLPSFSIKKGDLPNVSRLFSINQ